MDQPERFDVKEACCRYTQLIEVSPHGVVAVPSPISKLPYFLTELKCFVNVVVVTKALKVDVIVGVI
jgi:hypothetical protein